MREFAEKLPIDEVLADLAAVLAGGNRAILVAPPGAGKTTRAPLALMDEDFAAHGKIMVLEPRRLAARAAAERMAASLSERVGETIGLRVRLQSLVSAKTRVEIVTEGVFARMIVEDPELTGVAAVLFDEFHERSLDADLGLALALDAQGALREDLRILVMSATLDGARVSRLMEGAAAHREPGPRLSGRDPLSRPRSGGAHRGSGGQGDARGAGARSAARSWSSCPVRAKSRASPRRSPSACAIPLSRSPRSTARWTRVRRTAPSPQRRPGGARSCSPPRSPRPR